MGGPRSIMRRSAALSLAVSLAFLGAAPARADDPNAARHKEAAQRFAEGEAAFRVEDYRRAAEAFDAAYVLGPHYDVLWNAARAWERAGEAPRAANRYAKYLDEAPPDARDRGRASVALTQLGKRLGRLELNVPSDAEVQVDGQRASERVVYVTPGSHAIRIETAGHAEDVDVRVGAGAAFSVTPKRVSSAAPADASPATPATPPAAPRGGTKRWSPLVVYGGGALALLAGGFAVWSGIDTLDALDAFDRDPSQSNLDAGRGKQLRTNIAIGATAVLALATAACAVYLVDWRRGSQTQARLGVTAAGPVLSGRFE
jgi:tetratricopeptide (TPR) repeat protein